MPGVLSGFSHMLRQPLGLCDTPPSRFSVKRKSPSTENATAALHRRSSPPPYSNASKPVYSSNNYQQQTAGRRSTDSYSTTKNKSPRFRKSPVLTPSLSAQMAPHNGNSPRVSPRSCGPSPTSPPNKLGLQYRSSPDLHAMGSPDENTMTHNFVSPVFSQTGSGNPNSLFKCEICSKTFTSRSNLNKHKRVQHSGEEYTCPMCKRTFKNRYYIKEHASICATSTQKKAAAAAAAASASAGSPGNTNGNSPSEVIAAAVAGVGGGAGGRSSNFGLPSPAMTAVTPSAHLSALHAPMMTVPANLLAAAPRQHQPPAEVYKYEPPDDEQPTDLAIHKRDQWSNNSNHNSPG